MTLFHKSSGEYNAVLELVKKLAQNSSSTEAKKTLAGLFSYMKKSSNMPAKGKRAAIKENLLPTELTERLS